MHCVKTKTTMCYFMFFNFKNFFFLAQLNGHSRNPLERKIVEFWFAAEDMLLWQAMNTLQKCNQQWMLHINSLLHHARDLLVLWIQLLQVFTQHLCFITAIISIWMHRKTAVVSTKRSIWEWFWWSLSNWTKPAHKEASSSPSLKFQCITSCDVYSNCHH